MSFRNLYCHPETYIVIPKLNNIVIPSAARDLSV